MKRFLLILAAVWPLVVSAAELLPMDLCRGSRRPYPAPESVEAVPDSLSVVMISHVGRHGARYATSPGRFTDVVDLLQAHHEKLTPKGKRLLEITLDAIEQTDGRWGALDSLGRAEQQGIATRLCNAFPQLVVGQKVTAISSVTPRCVHSMEAFCSVVRRFQSGLGSVSQSSGEQYSPLMRPFAVDSAYIEWAEEKPYARVYDPYMRRLTPRQLVGRLIKDAELSDKQTEEFCASAYYVVSTLACMSSPDADEGMELLTPREQNDLWEIDNLRQYLSRTATTVSTLPADIARPLLNDIVQGIDDFIAGRTDVTLQLRFGHAETLMPLLSLMRLPGCYYLTYYWDTVEKHWDTWHVVPMAANLQLILLKSHSTGNYYVRIDLNERPIALGTETYLSWPRLRHLFQAFL